MLMAHAPLQRASSRRVWVCEGERASARRREGARLRECETGCGSLRVTAGGGDSPGTTRAAGLPGWAQRELGIQRDVQVALSGGTLLPGSCSPRVSEGTDLKELEALGTLGRSGLLGLSYMRNRAGGQAEGLRPLGQVMPPASVSPGQHLILPEPLFLSGLPGCHSLTSMVQL